MIEVPHPADLHVGQQLYRGYVDSYSRAAVPVTTYTVVKVNEKSVRLRSMGGTEKPVRTNELADYSFSKEDAHLVASVRRAERYDGHAPADKDLIYYGYMEGYDQMEVGTVSDLVDVCFRVGSAKKGDAWSRLLASAGQIVVSVKDLGGMLFTPNIQVGPHGALNPFRVIKVDGAHGWYCLSWVPHNHVFSALSILQQTVSSVKTKIKRYNLAAAETRLFEHEVVGANCMLISVRKQLAAYVEELLDLPPGMKP